MSPNGLFSVPQIDIWEAVATVSVVQALQTKLVSHPQASADVVELLKIANVYSDTPYSSQEHPCLNYPKAYRDVDSSAKSYHETLADVSGFRDLRQYKPVFSISATEGSDLILCPFSFKHELNLPVLVWTEIIQHLQSYGQVYLMGDSHQRLDSVGLAEELIISRLPIQEKLRRLASAVLVVGVPNGYTWAATGWDKKVVYFYPDSVPRNRWWPYPGNNIRCIEYDSHNLSRMLLLANLRKMIREF